MPDDAYDPACIRLLAGMEPPKRPAGFVEDDPREPLLPVDSPRVQAALESIMRDIGLTEAQILTRFPIALGERVALRAEDLSDREMALIMASTPDGPGYSLDDIPDVEARYPVEDGPGSGTRVELTVSVLVGTKRSTVIVSDPLTGRALEQELVHHGGEAGAAAVAVSAALRARLPGDPGGVPGGVPETPGELGE